MIDLKISISIFLFNGNLSLMNIRDYLFIRKAKSSNKIKILDVLGFESDTTLIQTPDIIKEMEFRHVGPIGNRVTTVAGIPNDPMTYYVGAASGGVWKTIDGGLNWSPIFDNQEVHSIGAISVAPSDPMTIYVGTGESSIRSNVSIGNGVYKSEDGGETWKHLGLENTGRISRIIIHPKNRDLIYVGSLGHAYSPQKERGVFMSENGGETWKHTLFIDNNTGCLLYTSPSPRD